jgi:peptidoglycan/LPS O-acetylase OafA/YrhL
LVTPSVGQQAVVAKPAESRRLHLNYLDGARAVAALYVMLTHVGMNTSMVANPMEKINSRLAWVLINLSHYGHYSVDVFILLSGFCLMIPVTTGDGTLRGGPWLFFKKRARRILPPYYLTILFAILADKFLIWRPTGGLWDQTKPITWSDLAMHGLLLQDLSKATVSRIGYPLWSISVEWRIYFLFPLLVACWKKFGGVKTVAVTMVSSYALLLALYHTPLRDVANPFDTVGIMPHYLGLFALGMLGAEVTLSRSEAMARARTRIPWPWLIAGLTLLVAGMSTQRVLHRVSFAGVDLFVAADAFCVLVFTGMPERISGAQEIFTRVLGWRPLVFVGTFSYSLYLMHAPLLEIIWQYVVSPLRLSPLAQVGVQYVIVPVLITGLCYLFFLACEKPFLTKKRA